MTDDRDDLESAKDWLADLKRAAGAGNEVPEDEAEAVDSGQEDPALQPVRSPRRKLNRVAELIDLDMAANNPWWRRWFAGGRKFSLVQDGDEVATISTGLERGEHCGSVKCRHTGVVFENGRWTISTHAPGPRQVKKGRLGNSYKASWTSGDRVVEVKDGSEQIAYLTDPKEIENPEVKTADGQSVALHWEQTSWKWARSMRKLATGDTLTVEWVQGTYLLTPTSPVPLEAALLHWHLILRDFVVPNGGGGG